jgi:hypothetical protein
MSMLFQSSSLWYDCTILGLKKQATVANVFCGGAIAAGKALAVKRRAARARSEWQRFAKNVVFGIMGHGCSSVVQISRIG